MALNQYGWFLDGQPAGLMVPVSAGASIPASAGTKFYFEVTIDSGGADGTSGYGVHFGIATSALVLNGTVATAINAAQANSQYGTFWNTRVDAGGTSGLLGWGYPTRPGGLISGSAQANGDVFGIALDTTNKKIWAKNLTLGSTWGGGVSEVGDPTANAYGADFSASGGMSPVTGAIFIICGCSHGSASAKGQGTINFGASAFTGTAPTGYVSIESVFPGAALNPDDNSNIVLSNNNLTFAGTNVPVTFSPAISGFTTNVGYSNTVRSRFSIANP